MPFADFLSNRELSWFIWGLIALITSLFSTSMRSSLWGIVTAFFDRKLFTIWLLMAFYLAQCTFLLWYLGFWNIGLLKDTIFFVIFSASMTFLKAYKIDQEKNFFKEMIKDNLKLGIFMEFLISLYTFSFLTEFLVLPAGIMLAGLLSISETDAKYIKVKNLINSILTIVGLYLIYHVVITAIYHHKELFILENLKATLLSPTYTLLYIPFLYLLSIHMVYEVQNIILDTAIKVPSLKATAHKYAFRYFRNDLDGLKRWVKRVRFVNPQTDAELLDSIIKFKAHLLLEQSPPQVTVEQGWSPYLAVNFMNNEKLKAGDYDCSFGNEWGACSGYLYVGDHSLMNTLSYYVNGNEITAQSLELVLKVFQPNQPADLLEQFLNQVKILFEKTTNESLPQKIAEAIINGKPTRLTYWHYLLKVKKEKWQNLTHGYDLVFTISIPIK